MEEASKEDEYRILLFFMGEGGVLDGCRRFVSPINRVEDEFVKSMCYDDDAAACLLLWCLTTDSPRTLRNNSHFGVSKKEAFRTRRFEIVT